MGLIAKLLSFGRVQTDEGAQVSDVKVDPGGGAIVTAQHFAPPGDDSVPLPGDYVACVPSGGTGTQSAIGYIDPTNEPLAEAGEKRIYARDSDGEVVGHAWLKNTGEIVVESIEGGAIIVLDASGNVTVTTPAGGKINFVTGAGGTINAGANSLDSNPLSGVVLGSAIDPLTGLTLQALGGSSSAVFAKKLPV